ncbi:MAG: hypothetical protein F2614_02780 [Actinobacteria bacterium]|jgi:hypothetical protein|uniref:Unannotated protein n=1 Tax=freshwater metagenome TaxID=449393 RepID=A0A6J6JD71_9ZZZZ|nr:hypothetical protein [Actinomycetota bacterium]
MKPSTSAEQLFKNVLGQTALLTGLIASLGSLAGFIVEGMNGVVSALIGAGLAFVFGALTVVSMIIGRKLSLAGFFGVVMGGWLIKLIGFALLARSLQGAEFINGPVLFLTLVAAILGSLVIDSIAVLSARIPVVEA